jgi:hypothetical protein
MMDTVPDKLKQFNRAMGDELGKTQELYHLVSKGEIELDEAMELWATRIDFMKFLIRKNNIYISMTQAYARKNGKKQHTTR